jgi:dihydroorotase
LLLAGGTVIDPGNGLRNELDVGIADGRIAAIGPQLPHAQANNVLDVTGCYIVPGLIDFHIHSYWGVNPYGFNADPVCIASGVTTAVDAGSAGPVNFSGFRKLVHEQALTRMLGFIALAQHGVLNDPGELENLRFADPEGAARTVAENRDIAVGIKIRLHKKSVGENGREALRLAVKAGDACRAPVMVHVGNTGITMEEIVESLRPGDIVTHCYTPQQPSILDDKGQLRTAVRRARERGVLFDVAHANGHFDFRLVRRAMGEGLKPDIISTDLHGRMEPNNPVVDLPTTLTKFLALGLTFDEVIAACTANPARAIGAQGRLGGLEKDGQADIAVLQLLNQKTRLRDCVGAEMNVEQRIVSRWTIRRGMLCGSNDQTIL